MGCDFSALVKQNFALEIENLQRFKQKSEKNQRKIQQMIDNFSEITSPQIDISCFRKELLEQMDTVIQMVEQIKLVGSSSNDSSLNISDSVIVSKLPSEKKPPVQKNNHISLENISDSIDSSQGNSEIRTPARKSNANSLENINGSMSPKERSLRSPTKLNTAESILEDPEIMALISKNRNKFLKIKK